MKRLFIEHPGYTGSINKDFRNDTMYFTNTYEHVIEQFSSLSDMGIILSEDGRFEHNIEKVSKQVRQKVG